jgi:glycosyltransferase involved in cell wall biosynthesis
VAQHVWHYRRTDRRAVIDTVLCPSRFMQTAVTRAGRPAVWLPNPNPPMLPGRVKRPEELTFVFAGRVEPEKGLVRLLEMLPADFAGKLIVLGEGVDRPAAEAVCVRRVLTGRVAFLGRRPHSEALSIIAAAHVLVLPSRWDENYPLSLIEALAAGTNLLVADRGGMREIVQDAGVGYRFQPDDPASLADQLRAIRDAHTAGTLNAFDATGFLAGRDEASYLAGVLRAYAGDRG